MSGNQIIDLALWREQKAAQLAAAGAAVHATAAASELAVVASAQEEQSAAAANLLNRLLARKQLSVAEALKALQPEYGYEIAQNTVDRYCAVKYLDDTQLAQLLVEKYTQQGKSSSEIRQRLHKRLIAADAVNAALLEIDAQAQQQLLLKTALERAQKLVGLEYPVAKRRLLGYLARRGWGGYEATQVAAQALAEAGIINNHTAYY